MSDNRIAPVHPGVYLGEIIDELSLSQYRLARDIHVSAMRISHIIKGNRPITAEMAIRLGLYFGQSPQYWINLQNRYDMDIADDRIGLKLRQEVVPLKMAA
ncbi:MAG: HigA family addiction module antidote protein [Nitrospirae bacterium]|nr:HigA family addiction module antidote protein [Nitrospirota bacterium]